MPTPDLIVRGPLFQGKPVDLLIAKGKVLELTEYDETRQYDPARVVDAQDLTLLPSLIDSHVHLREPGFEYKETIASGLKAAAHGGFGQVMAMANTNPVNDNATVTELMLTQAKKSWPRGPILHPIGALTKGLQGKELAPLAELADSGCVAFSNDGLPVENAELFRRAMEYASDLGRIVIDHCEDPHLGKGWVMNESPLSGRLGLKGMPTCTESIQVARDILLAGYLNIPVHLAHISSRDSVELIAWAKQRGFPVTAETCPHYLVFTEEELKGYDARAKVNPPLRTRDDVEALLQALRTGVIDILTTDHAPHARHEKEVPLEDAPNGLSGLDTALSMSWSLILKNELQEADLIRIWCTRPAEIFSLPRNTFAPGDPADFILFDTNLSWEVTEDSLHSKGKNTPCLGMTLPGRVQAHYIKGKSIV